MKQWAFLFLDVAWCSIALQEKGSIFGSMKVPYGSIRAAHLLTMEPLWHSDTLTTS